MSRIMVPNKMQISQIYFGSDGKYNQLFTYNSE